MADASSSTYVFEQASIQTNAPRDSHNVSAGADKSWASRLAKTKPEVFTDEDATGLFYELQVQRYKVDGPLISEREWDVASDRLDVLEHRLRQAHCTSNKIAAIKLMLLEPSLNPDAEMLPWEDDTRLLHQVVVYLRDAA